MRRGDKIQLVDDDIQHADTLQSFEVEGVAHDRLLKPRGPGLVIVWHVFLLGVAVTFMSAAATAFALMPLVPPLMKASWRLSANCVFQAIGFAIEWRKTSPADRRRWFHKLPLLSVSGLALAVHFGSWVWSLNLTSVTHSLLWVSTHPLVIVVGQVVGAKIWAARVSMPSIMEILGTTIGFIGGIAVVFDATGEGTSSLIGDAVAFLGAVTFVVYIWVGKEMRSWMPTFMYALPVTIIAALTTWAASAAVEHTTVFTPPDRAWLGWVSVPLYLGCVLFLALGPGILGHTLVSWLLKHLSTLQISVAMLSEPLVGSVIAWALGYQDMPGLWTWLGGPVLILGGVLVTVGQHKREQREKAIKAASAPVVPEPAPADLAELESTNAP